jgi:hypothetical protein
VKDDSAQVMREHVEYRQETHAISDRVVYEAFDVSQESDFGLGHRAGSKPFRFFSRFTTFFSGIGSHGNSPVFWSLKSITWR